MKRRAFHLIFCIISNIDTNNWHFRPQVGKLSNYIFNCTELAYVSDPENYILTVHQIPSIIICHGRDYLVFKDEKKGGYVDPKGSEERGKDAWQDSSMSIREQR
jgi:hypothetical protein